MAENVTISGIPFPSIKPCQIWLSITINPFTPRMPDDLTEIINLPVKLTRYFRSKLRSGIGTKSNPNEKKEVCSKLFQKRGGVG